MQNTSNFFFHLLPLSFYACLSIILGISLYSYVPLYFLVFLALTVFLATLWWYRIIPSLHFFVVTTFCLLGIVRIAHQIGPYQQFLFDSFNKPSTIIGLITNITTSSHPRFKRCVTLKVDTPGLAGMSLQLYTKPSLDMQVGDTVALDNITLKKPNKASYQNYLIK